MVIPLTAIPKIAGGIATFVESVTPKLEDEVVVEVIGEPGASKKSLYFLALSTAYGIARPGTLSRFLTPPPSLLMIEYDAADDWVRVTLKYKVGVLDFVNQAIGGTFLGPVIGSALNAGQIFGAAQLVSQLALLNGPQSTVVGATPVIPFSFLNVPLPITGVANPVDPALKPNPYIGADILTDKENVTVNGQSISTPNPKPSGDNRSRGSVAFAGPDRVNVPPFAPVPGDVEKFLVPLVFAALSSPGSATMQAFTPPQQGPYGVG